MFKTASGEYSATDILAAVNQAVQELIALGVTDGRTGGYFCLTDFESGEMLIPPTMVGEVANGKDEQYKRNCLEKAQRLSIVLQMRQLLAGGWNTTVFPGWTSFELRDEKRNQWGGAITTAVVEGSTYIFSISGFPEDVDEASMISTTVRLGALTRDQAVILAGRTRHPSTGGNEIIYRQMRADGTFIVS